MTYQPLNQKKHFSQAVHVFELLLQFSDSRFSEEELLIAADKLIHIGNGQVSAEKIREYSQKANYYSSDTYNMITKSPWKCVPDGYSYDEDTFPEISSYAQNKLNHLTSRGNYAAL